VNSNDREVDATGAGTLSSKGGSAERFGYEWDQYPEMRAAYEEQFLRWTPQLSKEDWKGETFLDVGCGMGRNSYWPMKYGAAAGVAIDIDERSLRAAGETLAEFPAVRVEEGDAYDIRYKDEFDIAFSIGVVQVLEFPKQSNEYFRLARTFSFSHLRSIVFDQFLPRVAHYWRREEVEAMMKNAGLVDVQLAWVNQISWTAIGARPE
jgi:SAM-dependent methyltransferase